ncbi:lycopene cyclase family protein [Candidatus Portiera aleyrodidarum]|uniref:Lycopene cyclase n=1 Tax=Candidatus Portiera aleyrodidarum MED (Bemisia tabaci) TaxID=1163752 RepID=A0AAU8RYK8_9GAMM|nr:lycopene cyclase family protein [Candidatus Portiera aleyrodidarum]AFQ24200.1 Lycopene cyclase protein [Candidatus Portiera aleyrodidarum BT-B-HRs]AFS18957.1 Lycopene cyclase [Candidatus Portiera aleyrodidarum BT-QVLC]AFT80612.1 lycopene cyclase [Candidatus Portiera aleyrodidarum BT-QVLC]AFT80889.1 lycopene cyclase [Candidatus Portiera aleyrodidarum BT-B-HRs]AJF24178.1 lycopene cyclase [Candidatus Portiera aleyrodidarum MED (Bemisia tabaci)]
MVKNDIDILILGGGCTGLSLAYYLSFLPNTVRIFLIENKFIYNNDKTWCGWRTKNHAFVKCCKIFWYSYYINKTTKYCSIINSSIPYENIKSIIFYKKILNRIQHSSNIKLYHKECVRITEYNNYVSVKLNNETYKTASWAIDTTPKFLKIPYYSPWKWQNFIGLEIELYSKIIGFEKPYLMNFFINKYFKYNKINFMYVLPNKINEFLFEWTSFSDKDKIFINTLLLFNINLIIGKYNYKLLRNETGHIPMAYVTNKTRIKNLVTLYGSYIRTSNGFSFHEIQSWAIKCAYNLSINKELILPNISYFLLFFDYIFMKTIELYPKLSLFLYTNLFYKINSNSLIYFFTNTSNLFDLLNILFFIQPKTLFLYTIFFYLFN